MQTVLKRFEQLSDKFVSLEKIVRTAVDETHANTEAIGKILRMSQETKDIVLRVEARQSEFRKELDSSPDIVADVLETRNLKKSAEKIDKIWTAVATHLITAIVMGLCAYAYGHFH